MNHLVNVLAKIVSANLIDGRDYDIEVLDFDEISFEKGSRQTRLEPAVPSKKTLKINSVFIAGLEPDLLKKGDQIKLNFSFTENGSEYYIENEVKEVEKVVQTEDGAEVYLKKFYAVYIGEPMELWATGNNKLAIAKDHGRFVDEKNVEEFFKMLGGLGYLVRELKKDDIHIKEYLMNQLDEKMHLLEKWSKKAFKII